MKSKLFIPLMTAVFVFGLCSFVQAGKPLDSPDGIYIGNGFPSGAHYNLNLKAKDPDTFVCPSEGDVKKYYCSDDGSKYDLEGDCDVACTAECIQIFGNVINFPYGDGETNYTILMESGIEEPRGKKNLPPSYPDLLEVTDWCVGFDNDVRAEFRLPADPDGYAVYARVTGDPKGDPSFDFTNPMLDYVEDDGQNLLLLFGFIRDGVFSSEGLPLDGTLSRTKGQKVKTATNITPLFMWSGDVCTFIDWGDGGTYTDQCCLDAVEPFGEYEECIAPSSASECCIDYEPDGTYDSCEAPTPAATLSDPPTCPAGYDYIDAICDAGYTSEVVYCITHDDKWVFNIAEFVGMLFDIDPAGEYKASLLQLRFYPLPLNGGEDPKIKPSH